MSEMAMAAGMSSPSRMEPRGPYTDRFGQNSPEDMPEIARELIMLRGAATSVQIKVNEIEANIAELREKISPVTDRREKPEPGQIKPLDAEQAKRESMELVSDIATELRLLQKQLNSATEHLEVLGNRLWTITRDVSL